MSPVFFFNCPVPTQLNKATSQTSQNELLVYRLDDCMLSNYYEMTQKKINWVVMEMYKQWWIHIQYPNIK